MSNLHLHDDVYVTAGVAILHENCRLLSIHLNDMRLDMQIGAVTSDLRKLWRQQAERISLRCQGKLRIFDELQVAHPIVQTALQGSRDKQAIMIQKIENVVTIRTSAKLVEACKELCTILQALSDEIQSKCPIHQPLAIPDAGRTVEKAILSLDMVGYSNIAIMIAGLIGQDAVAALNDVITTAVESALKEIRQEPEHTVMAMLGDGAILSFDSAQLAHDFSMTFLEATTANNVGKAVDAEKQFRIGISFGNIYLRPLRTRGGSFRGYRMAGIPIIEAVRLESQCPPGKVRIHPEAHKKLDDAAKAKYRRLTRKPDKHDTMYPGHDLR